MKHLKPGQLITYKRRLYRVKKATAGCEGCDLRNVFVCPNIVCVNVNKVTKVHCGEDNVIFKHIPDGNSTR